MPIGAVSSEGAVAVVGGGPAAAAAALTLAKAGRDVTLFRPRRAVEKPCGGAVPALQLPALEGFVLESLPAASVEGFLLENESLGRVTLDEARLTVVRRSDLDEALVQAAVTAGSRLVEAKVSSLERDGDGLAVSTRGGSERFSWCIGGDGARGLCRRSVAPIGPIAPGDSLGVGASLEGLRTNRLILCFPDLADSYLWIFPRPGGVSVGIAFTEGRLSLGAARTALRGFVERHLPGTAEALENAASYRYPIPVYSSRTTEIVERGLGRGILLVGDAAGVADPLTREGIRWAMLSGVFAAESLLESDVGSYPVRLAARLEPEMDRARRASRLFFEDDLARCMVPVARCHAGIRRVLGDLLAAEQPYSGLRLRLLRAAVGIG